MKCVPLTNSTHLRVDSSSCGNMEPSKKRQPFPVVEASAASLRTSNPIREVVDRIDTSQLNKSKQLIPLSIGDPTVFGNFSACEETIQAVVEVTKSCQANGYPKAVVGNYFL